MSKISIMIASESLTGHLLKEYFQSKTGFIVSLKSFDDFQESLDREENFSKTILLADAGLVALIDCLRQDCPENKIALQFLSSALFNVSKGDEEEQLAVKSGIKGIFYIDESIDSLAAEIEFLHNGGIRLPENLLSIR